MFTLTLAKSSLVCHLIDKYTSYWRVADDICGLIWQVLIGILMVLGLIVFGGFYLAGLVDFVLWLLLYREGYLSEGIHLLGILSSFTTVIVGGVFGSAFLCGRIADFFDESDHSSSESTSFLRAAYKSIHDKICFPVKVKEE